MQKQLDIFRGILISKQRECRNALKALLINTRYPSTKGTRKIDVGRLLKDYVKPSDLKVFCDELKHYQKKYWDLIAIMKINATSSIDIHNALYDCIYGFVRTWWNRWSMLQTGLMV